MSTTIEVTGVQPSTITVGRDLGFDPIVSALDSAATKALIVHARPLAARAQALRLAKDLGLGISGSSDYHGAGKPNRLGENLMPVEFYERVVDQGLLPILEG